MAQLIARLIRRLWVRVPLGCMGLYGAVWGCMETAIAQLAERTAFNRVAEGPSPLAVTAVAQLIMWPRVEPSAVSEPQLSRQSVWLLTTRSLVQT